MSETVTETTEARSSIKLTLNAKGEVQIEAKVRAGDEAHEVSAARQIAETNFDALRTKYRAA
jgi:hypothetical protein